jgi:hypothetical protein
VVLPTTTVILSINHYHQLSPLDEGVHLDYVDKVLNLELPRFGDRTGELSMDTISCRGVDWPVDLNLPPCNPSGTYSPLRYPAFGYQYQAHQPPLYYVVTAPIAKAMMAISGWDLLTAARGVGVLWLVSALAVLWLTMTQLKVVPFVRAIICTLVGVSPGAIYMNSIVSNDAAALLTGALLALLCVHATRWRRPSPMQLLLCGALGFAAVWFKPMNGVAVAAAAVFIFLIRRRNQLDRTWNPARLGRTPGGVLAVGCLIGVVSWIVIYRLIAYESYDKIYDIVLAQLKVDGLRLDYFTNYVPALFDGLTNPADARLSGAASVAPWATLLKFVMISFGAGWLFRRRDWASTLGTVAVAALALGGPAIVAVSYLQFRIAHHVPPRYGLALFPLLAISGAAVEKNRWAWVVLAALAGLLSMGTISFLLS